MVKPDPRKVEDIQNCVLPKTIKELRSFLGLANYCRAFIPMFASISKPLFDLLVGETKKSIKHILWSSVSRLAFSKLKNSISDSISRSQPDFNKKFIVITDASSTAIGGILAQKDKNVIEKMIYSNSKNLDKAQLNYSVTDKELLSIVKTLDHFRHYLLG